MAEFSFKEMKMRVQSKISSCCVSDRCESREIGGRGRSRLPTRMVESFSTDLLPAIKTFELCLLLGEQDTKLLHIISLLFEWGEETDILVYV